MTGTVPETCQPAWAHATGTIDLQLVSPVPTDLASVADRLMILETISRYAMAYDERRLDVLASVFTEDGAYRYRIGDGPIDGRSGRDELVEWLGQIMQSQTDQRRHMISSIVIDELSSDRAVAIAYKTIFAVEHTAQVVTTGFYRITLVKQNDRWLIKESLNGLDRPF